MGDARALYVKGSFDAAIAKYQEFQKERPNSPDGLAGIVHVYLKMKDVEPAAAAAEQGTALTTSPRMRVARAEVWFRQGKIPEAEKEWVDVINAGFPEARAYLGLSRMRTAIAMHKSSKRLLDKAHELDPTDPDIQESWMETLSRSERIHYLETSLAGDNNWDAERREGIASYLKYLKERSLQKKSPCRLVSKVSSTETPPVRLLMDPQHLRGYGLSVSINDHKSSLMLDTGASGILVNRSIAERAGVSKIVEVKIGGIGDKGRKAGFVGIADSIKVGDLEFQDCPIEIMDSRSVVGEGGLIGSDVFERFLVEMDFPNEKMRLSELPKRPGETDSKLTLNSEDDDEDESDSGGANSDSKPAEAKPAGAPGLQDRYVAPEMKSYTTFYRFGHDVLVPTAIGEVSHKLFLLDTGALMNAISQKAAREVTKVHVDSDIIVKGISGRVDKVYTANKAVLKFGHLSQENQEMTAFDTKRLSDSAGTEISGFLGFVTLRMLDIKIDYRDALIDFKFDSKRFGR